jgi:4-hydroxy-tetrahydrodipicolinate reductase
MALKLVIAGCCGRMGKAIAGGALQNGALAIGAALEAPGHQAIGRDVGLVLGHPTDLGVKVTSDARAAISQGDVVIDFTTPEATIAHAQVGQELRKPLVIGTTGLSDAQRETLRLIANTVPVVYSPNMSLGVNVLLELVRIAAQRLGTDYDLEIVEAHHRHKKDSPSGTARRFAEVSASARNQLPGAIPIHAVRAGDIIGDHTVILAGPAERLELTHRAHSRDVFAQGALKAAEFIVGQSPGFYDMSHVLAGART